MRTLTRISALFASVVVAATVTAQPQYQIYDIGVVQMGDTASQGFGVSPGGIAVGRSIRSNGSQAFTWTLGGGLVGLPNLAGRNHAVSNDANDNGIAVGTAATTLFGSSRLPVMWQSGVVSQLPLPSGQTLGDASGVNAAGVAVGSVDAGISQRGVIYNGGSATIITQTTANGSYFLTAFGINDSGRIVGQGIDPTNAARNVGIVYDMGSASAFEVGAVPGANGALAFAVGNGGHVVGSSMMNQGSGMPFIWSDANGIVAIPLAAGTSQGSARGVNSAGWVVGQDSSAFSIPFLWDGTTTYRIADLLPAGSGWDLDMNTSSSALGISDDGVIIGTGVHNGDTHAYAMVPVTSTPTPSPTPAVTPTPVPCDALFLLEDFDGVTPPDLPPGWTSSFTPGPANCTPAGTCALGTNWATSSITPSSSPNCAFHNDPGCVTDSNLDTPSFLGVIGTNVIFQHSFDLESGLDGAVLEISIDGGPFTDFVAAGGTFMGNTGYNGTISTTSLSPIAGRQAWTGNSNGYVSVFARMPNAADSHHVVLRFRLATDCSGAGTGWRLDDIKVILFGTCPTPTPTPASPTPSPTLTPSPTPSATPTPTSTPTPTPPPATPTPPPTATPSATPEAQPLNVSTRLRVQTGDNVGIGGFIVTGTASKHVLLRGIGPSLAASGIPDVLADPTLDLRDSAGVRILANDNWREMQEAEIIATGIPPTDNLESAIVETLAPGSYTVILRGMGMTTGVGLVEIYDLDQGIDSKLANLSTRAFVSTGDNVVIAGFILGGSNADRVIVRGIGPSLMAAGVPDPLADPTLQLRNGNGSLVFTNNDWQDDPTQAAEIMAAGLAPNNNLESAILATLPPDLYTALLAGNSNGTGVGLVEVYDLGP